MPRYKIAHIREQGQDIIIITLGRNFKYKKLEEKNRIWAALQDCATSAGLAGTVVLVWDFGGGRMEFLAPQSWHSFFKNISLSFVAANINKELTCE